MVSRDLASIQKEGGVEVEAYLVVASRRKHILPSHSRDPPDDRMYW